MKITPEQIRQIFDNPLPPQTVWERQFDGDQEELENLVRKNWQDITIEELTIYLLDLQWLEDLQLDLFRYLFPACLKCWYQALMQNKQPDICVPDLLDTLYYGNTIERMLIPPEREATYNFFHDAFIERIEAERGFIYTGSATPAYNWIIRFGQIGCIAPIINRIWLTWWSLDSPGKAVSAIMYASGIIYLKGENPIFEPWTPEKGGGGPYIIRSHSRWLEENLLFLQETLSVKYFQDKLQAAADVLREQPEANLAAQIAKDALEREDIISIRIDDLIAGLEGWEVNDD